MATIIVSLSVAPAAGQPAANYPADSQKQSQTNEGGGRGDILVATATALLFVSTIALVIVTFSMGKRQENLQNKLNEYQIKRDREHLLFVQRSQLIPLWSTLSTLSDINPADPIIPDVIKAANALEIVALTIEGGVLDRDMILRTFRTKYKLFYDSIDRCPMMPRLGKTGKQILEENPAAQKLYRELEDERLNAGVMNKTGG